MFEIEEGDPFRKNIIEKLKEHNWDIDACVVPLFTLLEERKAEAQKKEIEKKNTAVKKEHQEKAMRFLSIMFEAFTPEEILRVLEKNDGDVDATTEHFLEVVQNRSKAAESKVCTSSKKEPKDKEKKDYREVQKERERKFLTDSLCQRFSEFPRVFILEKLESCNWVSEMAVEALLAERASARNMRLSKIIERAPEPIKTIAPLSVSLFDSTKENEELRKIVVQNRNSGDAASVFKRELEKKIRGPYSDQLAAGALLPPDVDLLSAQQTPTSNAKRESKLEHPIRPKPAAGRKSPTKKEFQAPSTASTASIPSTSASEADDAKENKVKLSVLPKKDELLVEWEIFPGCDYRPAARDFITLSEGNDVISADNYETWKWTGGHKKGTLTFNTSSLCGKYVVQYIGSDKRVLGLSSVVQIGPAFSMRIVKPQNNSTMPMEVSVLVEMESSSTTDFPSSSWIALYEKTDKEHRPDNRTYNSYQWVLSTSQLIESEVKDGVSRCVRAVPFTIPKAGVFEFRFFSTKAYKYSSHLTLNLTGHDTVQLVKEGDQMIVNVKLSTINPAQDPVWIGIFHANEKNIRQYRRYKYVSQAGISTYKFKACIHTGDYEARLLANRSSDVLATSDIVHVDGVEGAYWI